MCISYQYTSMVALILFSILIGAIVFALLQVKSSVNAGPASKQIQEKQKNRVDKILVKWKEEAKEIEKKKVILRDYLESKENLTLEEMEKREEMRAQEIHEKEVEAMNRGDIPYNLPIIHFSARLKQKDDEVRAKSLFPDAPSSLGLKLREKNPSTKRWNMEMEVRARAPIGAMFEWLSCGVMGEPDHIVSHVLIRVNDTHRWHQLIVTRDKSETLEEVLEEYVKTLNKRVFHGNEPDTKIVPPTDVPTAWVIWNTDTQSWNIRP